MINKKDIKKTTVHFIGIGGIGMSGIAELMIDLGYIIQGSDINLNPNIERLIKRGIKFFKGHNKKNIDKVSVVVFSSAIKKNNPELIECKKHSIPVISRADMLAELMRFKKSIAIAGSHGKTTTTSLVGAMFDNAKFDPSIVNGGIINSYSKNNRFGKGEWMIVEADESDGSFLRLPHQINIITNIDIEHLDFYKTKENLLMAFNNFITNLPFYGYSIMCIDSENLNKISKKVKNRNIITYSINKKSDIKIKLIKKNKTDTEFSLYFKKDIIENINGTFFFKTNLLGDHNILNATAAIIASLIAKISLNKIKDSLRNFQGVKRRFSFIGTIGKAMIYDDYAHHPSEIRASYQIAKQIKTKKIIVIFQPHRFSRTKILFNDFIKVLSKVDTLYLIDIYSAGENPLKNINSQNLVKNLKKINNKVYYISRKNNLKLAIEKHFDDYNTIIFMGAGSITNMAHNLFNKK